MTADEARALLPQVTVRYNGEYYTCTTCGRLCDFAAVYCGQQFFGEWSWEAIARSATTGKYLLR